jgi:uncharacterized membrane protein YhaH (DUF805 family)
VKGAGHKYMMSGREKGISMGFTEAIKSGFDNYVKFDGRSARPAYWWWFLFAVLAAIGANIVDRAILDTTLISALVGLGLFLPGLAVSVRRLHDIDHSGWWILIGLIPIIGFIVLIVFYVRQSDQGENRFGPAPVAAPSVA